MKSYIVRCPCCERYTMHKQRYKHSIPEDDEGGSYYLCTVCHRTRHISVDEQASALNPLSPGYSGCGHCHRNWRICQSHSTKISGEEGVFPLCEECWEELSIEQRLPYYQALWDKWQEWGDSDEEEWERIEEAVRRGL